MGQNAQPNRSPRGVISLDWMLLTVAGIALLLLVGTMVRISGEDDPSRRVGDLFSMQDSDTLLAFQDFSFDATGWTPNRRTDQLPGMGPVLGPFTGEPVQRAFAMPVNTQEVHIMFDLHMLGAWGDEDRIRVSLGDVEVLVLRRPGEESGPAVDLSTGPENGIRVGLDHRITELLTPNATLPAPVQSFATYLVRMRVSDPGESVVLRLMAQDNGGDAQWSLDNLTIVATVGPGR